MRRAALVPAVGACLAVALSASPSTAADSPGTARAGAKPSASTAAGADSTAAAAADYQRVLGLTQDQALAAAAGADGREDVYRALVEQHGATFGGAWFEPASGVVHVAVTTPAAAERASALGRSHGVAVRTRLVRRSFAQLEELAGQLRADRTGLGRAAAGQVGIDVRTNEVVVAVPRTRLAGLRTAVPAPAGARVTADPGLQVQEDAGCTTRTACDWTVRAGAVLWSGSAANRVCSVGFTGRTSTGTRYTLTAGHCSSGTGVTWGTGSLAIGPLVSARNTGAVDAALIQVTNPWFTGDLGGEIYHPTVASRSLPVNGVAPTLGFIVAGERVCLSANFTNPSGPNRCGVVGTTSDPAVRGMVRVDGLDACGGDSGGGWYWWTSSGTRWAYGIHSRSSTGCGAAGGSSWFSAVPTVKSTFAPGVSIETR